MLASENVPTTYLDLSPYLKKPNVRLPNLNSNADKMVARRTRSSAMLKSTNQLLVVKSTSEFQLNKQSDSGLNNHLPESDNKNITTNDISPSISSNSPKKQKESTTTKDDTFSLTKPLKTNFKLTTVRTPKDSNIRNSDLNKTELKAQGWNIEPEISFERNKTGFLQANIRCEDYLASFDSEATPTLKGFQSITPKKNSRLKTNILPIVSSPYNQLPSQEAKTPVKAKMMTPASGLLKNSSKLNHTISEGDRIIQAQGLKTDESTESATKVQKSPDKRFQNPRVKILRKAIQGSQNHLSFEHNTTFTGATPSHLNTSIKVDNIIKQKDNRTVFGFAQKTRAGKLPGKPFKPNQDSFITYSNFSGHPDKFIFGVCDGHGVNGHLVSSFIKTNLPKNLEIQYKTAQNKDNNNINNIIKHSFLKTDKQLSSSSIDAYFSGSTTVSVLIFGTHLWCANVGDSRAILAKWNACDWTAHPLSNDHKPGVGAELERIIKAGGRVEPFKDLNGGFVGPDRVWLKNDNIPGLAMSRSIGDKVACGVGVIAEPEIFDLELSEEDKFVIIGSDGLWEFLSNEQVMEIFRPYYLKNQLELGCNALVRKAAECWNKLDDMVDDITCVAISLKVPPRINFD